MQEYAANAYKTAGMSANEYMSTVTSFSASLLQSLGGDTDKAAEYANQALTDMSDNANKMGTDMSLIQNAYQGFAKQNYTMLDNLKLGYGGTKEEMARLIEDAAKLSDTVDAQDMSFANIVKAINVVQTEMGITGTTAKEAASTIQGSVGMMKSSWTNLVTGIADENANLDVLISNFVDSVGTVAQNIVPKIGVALNSASKLISDLIPVIVQEIPVLIKENLPMLAKAAVSIIQSLVDGIRKNQNTLMATAFETIVFLANSLISMLPQIVALGLDLIVSLANGIAESLPELIPTIIDVVLQIVDTLTNPDTLSGLVNAAIAIMIALANGIVGALPTLIEKAPEIIQNLVTAIVENVPKLLETGLQIITTLYQGLADNFSELITAGAEIIDEILEGSSAVLHDIYDFGKKVVDKIKQGISDAWDGLVSWFEDLWNKLFKNRSVDVDVDYNAYNAPTNARGRLSEMDIISTMSNGQNTMAYSGSSGRNSSGITIVQNIAAVPQTPVELAAATAAYFEQARWAF